LLCFSIKKVVSWSIGVLLFEVGEGRSNRREEATAKQLKKKRRKSGRAAGNRVENC